MAWENFNVLFPDGQIPGYPNLTQNFLQKNEVDVIMSQNDEYDGHMLSRTIQYFWGKDGSYGLNLLYDVQSNLRHAENVYALNDYGALMLKNYLNDKHITIDLPTITDNETINEPYQILEKEGLRYLSPKMMNNNSCNF